MTTTTVTLASFLLARLEAEEAEARDAQEKQRLTWASVADGVATQAGAHVGWFVFNHDPARVLAEVAAKRAIVEAAQEWDGDANDYGQFRIVLRALAAVYADHPDFDESWR